MIAVPCTDGEHIHVGLAGGGIFQQLVMAQTVARISSR